jgi:hypothetical protein
VKVRELNEFEMLNIGLNYVIRNNTDREVFTVDPNITHLDFVEKIPVSIKHDEGSEF